MRTQKDINLDKAENELRQFMIDLYNKYEDLNVADILEILSRRTNSEIQALKKYYIIKGKK